MVDGVHFTEVELRNFVDPFQDVSDAQALAMLARAFDRPAFRTPFQQESNLHAFQQAIDDTIRVLRHCGCGNPTCPTFMLTPRAAQETDQVRDRVLTAFRKPYPAFNVVME